MKRFIFILAALVSTAAAQIIPSTGNVRGPTSATDNAIARFDGTTGKLVQNSGVTIDDSSNLTVSGSGGVTASDLTLGTSGPSVKSTLSARAPRQGLVFDGTAGGSSTLSSAIGTSDFSIDLTFTVPTAANFSGWGIVGVGNIGSGNVLSVYIYGNDLNVALYGATGSDYRNGSLLGLVTSYAGKTVKLTVVRNATTPSLTVYVNGISQTVNETTGGTPPTWAGSITSTTFYVGKLTTANNYYTGFIGIPNLYNRALSASEVVALYESGAPAGADYNSASNTSIISGNDSTFTSGLGSWVAFGTGTSLTNPGGTLRATGNSTANAIGASLNAGLTPGKRYRVTLTVSASDNQTLYIGATSQAITSTPTTYTVQYTQIAGHGSSLYVYFDNPDTTLRQLDIDNITVYPLGLLLAPDAVETGLGYEWHDQSGNGAHIALPSSGVTWNLPSTSRNYISGTTSTNGNEKLLGASVLLPANSRITSIQARCRSGTPSITIGTASGGAQLVASVALSTTWKNLTVALTDGVVSSADDVWVGSNSTDVVEVRINYEALSF